MMIERLSINKLAKQLKSVCLSRQLTLAVAESCTGGMLSTALTHWSGSSTFFVGSVISYSNAAKSDVLGISANILQQYGAVSQQVSLLMSQSVRTLFQTDITIAITGLADQLGDNYGNPGGRVWIACGYHDDHDAKQFDFVGTRQAVRQQAAHMALTQMLDELQHLSK